MHVNPNTPLAQSVLYRLRAGAVPTVHALSSEVAQSVFHRLRAGALPVHALSSVALFFQASLCVALFFQASLFQRSAAAVPAICRRWSFPSALPLLVFYQCCFGQASPLQKPGTLATCAMGNLCHASRFPTTVL